MADEQPPHVKANLLLSKVSQASPAEVVHWVLRLGAAGCFVGHGAFGIITKPDWLRYFAFAGIGPDLAYRIMPLIGSMDILTGLLVLFYPVRALLVWATVWTLWTALLRPLTGEGPWEFLERAGNYGVPIALLCLAGWPSQRQEWFAPVSTRSDFNRNIWLAWVLRVTVSSLLIGHGGFGAFMHKHSWTHYLATLRFFPDDGSTLLLLQVIGWFEIALGVLVLVRPSAEFLLFVFVWKVFTEMLRPLSGEPFWEFIERFGSYSAALALFFVLLAQRSVRSLQNAGPLETKNVAR